MFIRLMKTRITFFCAILAVIQMVLLYMQGPVWTTKVSIESCEDSRSLEGNTTKMTWQEYEMLFKTSILQTTYNCKVIEEIGSAIRKNGEGVHSTCMNNVYKPRVPCIVYAFGMKTESHKRSGNLWFYNIGLRSVDSDNFTPHVDSYVNKSQIFTWKVRTLKSIMEMLGHTNITIDVLKMDIEGYEFDVLTTMMDDGTIKHVRQLLGEWHIRGDQRFEFSIKYFVAKRLLSYGFKTFNYNVVGRHGQCKKIYCLQANLGFVNTKFRK
ncbi:unnamed protein product [Owenia fusiformis]|uniref:Methyltransferase FkbM domain-containing protein n=1 Tax=Owenia fusiformis TaxID=6347 RepID=A0A8S4PNM3_OWEFU|nr:unnamed protein product [Owenia fusiformis]